MRRIRTLMVMVFAAATLLCGCQHHEPQYGSEVQLSMPGLRRQVWAVAPTIDLSGENVDPFLQSDLVFSQLQQVHGLTVIPVNRVVEVFMSLKIAQVQSPEEAAGVCELLGCDALVVPTVTLYDPYNPPKFGAALQLFEKPIGFARTAAVVEMQDPATQEPTTKVTPTAPVAADFKQAVGMFDAANGSTREDLWLYAEGRNDPKGPMGAKEYVESMDRYCGFAYHQLIRDLLNREGNR
jgi:hypothetical protein